MKLLALLSLWALAIYLKMKLIISGVFLTLVVFGILSILTSYEIITSKQFQQINSWIDTKLAELKTSYEAGLNMDPSKVKS